MDTRHRWGWGTMLQIRGQVKPDVRALRSPASSLIWLPQRCWHPELKPQSRILEESYLETFGTRPRRFPLRWTSHIVLPGNPLLASSTWMHQTLNSLILCLNLNGQPRTMRHFGKASNIETKRKKSGKVNFKATDTMQRGEKSRVKCIDTHLYKYRYIPYIYIF